MAKRRPSGDGMVRKRDDGKVESLLGIRITEIPFIDMFLRKPNQS